MVYSPLKRKRRLKLKKIDEIAFYFVKGVNVTHPSFSLEIDMSN